MIKPLTSHVLGAKRALSTGLIPILERGARSRLRTRSPTAVQRNPYIIVRERRCETEPIPPLPIAKPAVAEGVDEWKGEGKRGGGSVRVVARRVCQIRQIQNHSFLIWLIVAEGAKI